MPSLPATRSSRTAALTFADPNRAIGSSENHAPYPCERPMSKPLASIPAAAASGDVVW